MYYRLGGPGLTNWKLIEASKNFHDLIKNQDHQDWYHSLGLYTKEHYEKFKIVVS